MLWDPTKFKLDGWYLDINGHKLCLTQDLVMGILSSHNKVSEDVDTSYLIYHTEPKRDTTNIIHAGLSAYVQLLYKLLDNNDVSDEFDDLIITELFILNSSSSCIHSITNRLSYCMTTCKTINELFNMFDNPCEKIGHMVTSNIYHISIRCLASMFGQPVPISRCILPDIVSKMRQVSTNAGGSYKFLDETYARVCMWEQIGIDFTPVKNSDMDKTIRLWNHFNSEESKYIYSHDIDSLYKKVMDQVLVSGTKQ